MPEMLSAFLSPTLLDWALVADKADGYHNLWLVRKSTAKAFVRGYFHHGLTSLEKSP